jgi:transposase
MSQPFSLNKFEKEKRVIEMYLAGKTIREISKEVHMSFRDISKIIKAYEKKQNLALKEKLKIDSSHIKKKLSKNTQAFKLFHDGKKLMEVAIFLQILAENREIMVTIHEIGKNV